MQNLVRDEDGYIESGHRTLYIEDLHRVRQEITWQIEGELEEIDENWDSENKTVEEMFNKLREAGRAWVIHNYY